MQLFAGIFSIHVDMIDLLYLHSFYIANVAIYGFNSLFAQYGHFEMDPTSASLDIISLNFLRHYASLVLFCYFFLCLMNYVNLFNSANF